MKQFCDYEGSTYRADFWEGQGREYEDRVERAALHSLLPAKGRRLLELGSGYGRLADLYAGCQHVILSDRAFSQIKQARDRLGGDPCFTFIVADAYALPFVAGAMDQVVSVRVLHHLVDVPAAFAEIARVLSRGGTYVTEFASKRHLKAIARYLLNRQPPITVGSQRANPFSPDPYEFAALNFDFHPRWIERALQQAGLKVEARRAVSHFRVTSLKRLVPLGLLVAADRALQRAGAVWPWTPSLFIRARKP
ncbi:MAG: methyltransferase domain-containing protein [Chloroflexi bacterium]|nr:methyltransferase domain-containing protein [Chloroflexota bacterium]